MRPADGIRPFVFLHVQSVRYGRGRHSCVFFSEPLLEQKLTTLSLPQWMVSGRAKVSKLIPTVRARRPHRRPPTPVRRPPPSAAPPSRGEQREHRGAVRPPPSPEPSVIHLTPDRPLLRLPTGKFDMKLIFAKTIFQVLMDLQANRSFNLQERLR